MKKSIFIIASLLIACAAMAQEKPEAPKRNLQEEEFAFIQEKQILTDAEFDSFKALYSDYRTKSRELRQSTKCTKKDSAKALTEDEAKAILKAKVERRINSANLYKDYIENLQKSLPATKILEVQKAQEEFKHESFKMIRGPHGSGNPHRINGPKEPEKGKSANELGIPHRINGPKDNQEKGNSANNSGNPHRINGPKK